jgi:hypothetical protein
MSFFDCFAIVVVKKNDAVLTSNLLPKETLGQYLYTHYVKKVGLKNLVEENLNALLHYSQV